MINLRCENMISLSFEPFRHLNTSQAGLLILSVRIIRTLAWRVEMSHRPFIQRATTHKSFHHPITVRRLSQEWTSLIFEPGSLWKSFQDLLCLSLQRNHPEVVEPYLSPREHKCAEYQHDFIGDRLSCLPLKMHASNLIS